MATIPLRQIRAVIAVCEEGSFTRAAQRENATQSGISQHVAAVERTLKVKLFERTSGGVTPTPAGLRYYKRCVEAVGTLEHAAEEARSLAGEVTGELRIGLMPTFTRAVLAPVLDDFVPRCPEVRLHIVEGYSALLTEMVLDDALDFAVVPAFEGTIGLKSRMLVRDREMMISGPKAGFKALAPLRLAECRPLKIVVPGPDNIRRRNLETYFQAHGVEIAAMLEMDAMIATLEFVARSDWVTISAERDLSQRHQPRRIDRQSDRRAGTACGVRGDSTKATHTVDASAPVSWAFRAGSFAYSRCVGPHDHR